MLQFVKLRSRKHTCEYEKYHYRIKMHVYRDGPVETGETPQQKMWDKKCYHLTAGEHMT